VVLAIDFKQTDGAVGRRRCEPSAVVVHLGIVLKNASVSNSRDRLAYDHVLVARIERGNRCGLQEGRD